MDLNPQLRSYSSGYIDLNGIFYGCEDRTHSKFAPEICERLSVEYGPDAEQCLDFKGWVKVCSKGFFWFRARFLVNKKQLRTMRRLMDEWGLVQTNINHVSRQSTLEEAFEENRAIHACF